MTASLASHGPADCRRASTRIRARPATDGEQRLPDQAAGPPVFVTEAVDVDVAGAPSTFAVTVRAGERVQLTVRSGQGG